MKKILFVPLLFLCLTLSQNTAAQELPVVIEAEDGILGADFRVVDTLGIRAVTVKSNVVNSYNPGSDERVITFEVTFPDTGTYHLFAHILTGPNTFDDDSYFYGNGFGLKSSTTNADWIRANGLAGVGYSVITDLVYGAGSAQSGVWKWLNMSRYMGDATPVSFRIDEGSLTRTFQIGARENGFYIDKLIFGRKGLFFTVSNLNNGEPGTKVDPATLPPGTPLADGQEKFLGSAWDYVQAPYFAGLWNQSTPGNAGKWGSVEYVRNSMNWTVLDSTYNVAKRYNMLFKEHTLIWGAQQPSWIGDLDATTQRQEIEGWFAALANRYPDIDMIDVVNEPIHNAPNGMVPWGTTVPNVDYADALGGAGASGWDWIITSFRLARQYFPNAKLIINEYSVINSTSTTQKYIEIINLLKAENLIDGIGEQGHAFTTYGTSSELMKTNLDLLAATGIPIYITELDIDGPTDLTQLKEYQRVFPLFWEHPGVAGVTLWGYRYGVWRQDEKAYIIDENNIDRPAMHWLKAYVNDTLTLMGSVEVLGENTGDADTLMVGEKIQLEALVQPYNTTIPNLLWTVNYTNLASVDQDGWVTALNTGTVLVKATAWDGSGVNGTRKVVILSKPVEAIQLSSANNQTTVYVNETIQMSATVLPSDASVKTITWSVAPAEKAFINSSGLMKGKIAGLVTVTASATDGSGVYATMDITVINRLTEAITVTSREDSLLAGSTMQMYAQVEPVNVTNPAYTWSVDPAAFAEISSSGVLTGLQEGLVTVTATAADESGVTGTKDIRIYKDHTATASYEQDGVTVYPNPAPGGKFTIAGLSGTERIELLDLSGKICAVRAAAGTTILELQPACPAGLYMIRITREDGKLITRKIALL